MPGNKVKLADPKTLKEREKAASRCCAELGLTWPTLCDGMDDAANLAYAAWPERLYVIGKDGKIAYAGGMGPFKFSPGECEAFLKEHLADPKNCKAAGKAEEKPKAP
jgi:hypothetical protein